MKTTLLRCFLLLCASASLTACGGAGTATAPDRARVANMPVADCEAQACRGLRIVDANAETFRADSARRDALAAAVARLEVH